MEPHAETPPPPVLSPELTDTLELLAPVSARTHFSEFRHRILVASVSPPQPHALNQNHSIV